MSGKRRRYEITTFDPEASAKFAVRVLSEAGVPGGVIGTVGAWPHLAPGDRFETKDLDVAVREDDTVWVEQTLRKMGVKLAQLDIGGVKVELPIQGIHVDFVDRHTVVQLSKLFREAIEATKKAGSILEIGDVEIEAVPIEYIVAMKLATARPKDDFIIRALFIRADLNIKKAFSIVDRHLGIAAVNRLRELVGLTR